MNPCESGAQASGPRMPQRTQGRNGQGGAWVHVTCGSAQYESADLQARPHKDVYHERENAFVD
jgi:hypothetical protein